MFSSSRPPKKKRMHSGLIIFCALGPPVGALGAGLRVLCGGAPPRQRPALNFVSFFVKVHLDFKKWAHLARRLVPEAARGFQRAKVAGGAAQPRLLAPRAPWVVGGAPFSRKVSSEWGETASGSPSGHSARSTSGG